MQSFEIAGNIDGTSLRFDPTGDGRLTMTVMHWHTGRHDSVILRPEWLGPLAAWLAGEAEPVTITAPGDACKTYGRRLVIDGDELAEVYSTHTVARLDCRMPFGTARVAVSVRRGTSSLVAVLSPEARQAGATWLRRAGAQLRVTRG